MSKNVMIPLSLLKRTIELIEALYYSNQNEFYDDYCDILWSLKIKIHKLELRDAYAKIISTENTDDRDDARMEYFRQKRRLSDITGDSVPF